ncbi:unnamed protein product, partial [Mesorhabditis belari]|uniref:Uncharacterized protein n=1 Tax=Mesorhabditis belari TaxID=2138241 RepID=A0AAF3E918_9BILA
MKTLGVLIAFVALVAVEACAPETTTTMTRRRRSTNEDAEIVLRTKLKYSEEKKDDYLEHLEELMKAATNGEVEEIEEIKSTYSALNVNGDFGAKIQLHDIEQDECGKVINDVKSIVESLPEVVSTQVRCHGSTSNF